VNTEFVGTFALVFFGCGAAGMMAKELQTRKEFPSRQKPGSFSVGDALEKLQNSGWNSDN
jgi:glycerol uptake facilitator-like aquaporin